MYILGISALYHDSAVCLLKKDKIVSAVQEERFTRIKHDSSFPINSIKFILEKEKIRLNDINYIVFYDKPLLKFERILETYLFFSPKGFKSFRYGFPIWIKQKLFQKKFIKNELKKIDSKFDNEIYFSEHHLSHAASAFYPSPFEEAIILTIDGVGEWATTSISIGNKNSIKTLKEIHFPHSLGLLYSAFTYYLGFKVNEGEYKIMGLAPYGEPIFKELILKNLVNVKDDGSFKLNLKYFDYCTGLTMTNKLFDELFSFSKRNENDKIKKIHMDIAASIQKVLEEIVFKIVTHISTLHKSKNLCLAGGVALNCVANGKLLKKKIFKNIWIQPAAGDAGGAIGCAYEIFYSLLKNKRKVLKKDSMNGSYLGPSYSNIEIKKILKKKKINFTYLNDKRLVNEVARELSKGSVCGWMQGRMEFGPRALGNRSIIADPRNKNMQKDLNLKIKFRESFRPFAPAILLEDLKDWFELTNQSPYMLLVSSVKNNKLLKSKITKGIKSLKEIRSKIPAVTHVDNSARVQTVTKSSNKLFYNLLKSFKKVTKCPILVNTSFNIKDEPIVCNPSDAINCFFKTGMDILVIGNYMIRKK